jgi:hypothetical protein
MEEQFSRVGVETFTGMVPIAGFRLAGMSMQKASTGQWAVPSAARGVSAKVVGVFMAVAG